MGSVWVDLKAAGLTHAKGKSDRCDGEHEIAEQFITGVAGDGWVPADGLEKLFQRLHEQAHPDGTAYWDNCREASCEDAYALLNGGE